MFSSCALYEIQVSQLNYLDPSGDALAISGKLVLYFQYSNYTCRAINVLGEADGHVILFETVVPICPPACDGYNYSSGQDKTTYFFTGLVLLLSAYLVWLKLKMKM